MRSTRSTLSLSFLLALSFACTEGSGTSGSEGSETAGDGDGDPAGDGDGDGPGDGDGDGDGPGDGDGDGDGDGPGDGDGDTSGDGDGDTPGGPIPSVSVNLTPQPGVEGSVRVNFGLPFAAGQLVPGGIEGILVRADGDELASARRILATHPDGSLRSVQVQVEVDVGLIDTLDIEFGGTLMLADLELVPVAETLVNPDGSEGPQVWVSLPPPWLAASGVAGPLRTESEDQGTPFEAWTDLCNYETYDFAAFEAGMGSAGTWLYDRGTTAYRGYARGGQLGRLESAYRESAIYRAGLTGSGAQTDISVPGKSGDLKYFYAQNLAIHYLLSGDDRFRESAEDIALAAAQLWADPGGADFWTERHAGFALLAYVWAAAVSDDQGAEFRALADTAVAAYVELQAVEYPGASQDARCFRHHADAHGEPYGYMGCSPWMSAILADGLDAYARQRPGTEEASVAHDALLRLGRIVATQGRDGEGKPFYWMGPGEGQDEVDGYDEHWGESAYVVGIAVDLGAAELEPVALELIDGLAMHGSAPHIRSFNWQCRSAVASSWFLAD